MDLQTYLTILRERWLSALLTAVVVLAAVAGFTAWQTPTYQATNRVFVQTRSGSSVDELNSGLNFASEQITTYADLALTPLVLEPVIEELELTATTDELSEQVTTLIPADTLILEITVRSVDPAQAAAIANATSESLQREVSELEDVGAGSSVELTVVDPAQQPTSASSPNLLLNGVAGIALALLTGFGVAVLRALSDNRIRKPEDIAKHFDEPVIAMLPHSRDSRRYPLVVAQDPQSPESEAYRKLRTNLQFIGVEEGNQGVLVTSSIPGEGKSATAINLAHVLAQSGDRVLLIDADLRRPSLHDYLNLESGAGLTSVLIGRASLEEVTQPLPTPGLDVLTSGTIPPNPSEMLGSAAMRRLLDTAKAAYDFVVVDTSPLLAVTDAAVLSRVVGGTVVVAQREKVKKPQLEQTLQQLAAVEARVYGVILNRAVSARGSAYRYAYTPDRAADGPEPGDDAEPQADRGEGQPEHVPTHAGPLQGELLPPRSEPTAPRPPADAPPSSDEAPRPPDGSPRPPADARPSSDEAPRPPDEAPRPPGTALATVPRRSERTGADA